MDTVNQTNIYFNAQSANTPELSDRLKTNDLDFASILLKGNADNTTGAKTNPRDSHSQEANFAKTNEEMLLLHQELKPQASNLNSNLFNKIDETNRSFPKSSEKVAIFGSPQMHKNQVTHLRVGESQSSTKKELYEQSAFAINKLSYLDVAHTTGAFSHQNTLTNVSHAIAYSDIQNNTVASPNKISSNQQVLPMYPAINSQAKDQDLIENKIVNNSSAQLVNNPYLIEKCRVMVTSFKNEQNLYIRDHFASSQQLDSTVSTILRTVKYTLSKIFVNGKER